MLKKIIAKIKFGAQKTKTHDANISKLSEKQTQSRKKNK